MKVAIMYKYVSTVVVLAVIFGLVQIGWSEDSATKGTIMARERYDAAIHKAASEYQAPADAADNQLLEDLRSAQKTAMKNGDLSEANSIDAELKRVAADAEQMQRTVANDESDITEQPKSDAIVNAHQRYVLAMQKAASAYQTSTEAARKQYLEDLQTALKAAMKNSDLPEANAIDAEIKKIEADSGQSVPSPTIFSGQTAGIKSVVFVCEASGSMSGTNLDALRMVLKRSIDGLEPPQTFNVIFFKDPSEDSGNPYIKLAPSLLLGNPANKAKANGFLDNITVQGSTNPLHALDEAFRQHPQLIFLLTDGEFDDPAPEQVIANLNKNKTAKVSTILFLGSHTDQNRDYEQTMRKIATENGGLFKELYSGEYMANNAGK